MMPQEIVLPPEAAVIGEVIVEPSQKIEFCVGVYEASLPQPSVSLEYQPRYPDHLQAALVRVDREGEFSLVYHLKNNGKVACQVTFRTWWPD